MLVAGLHPTDHHLWRDCRRDRHGVSHHQVWVSAAVTPNEPATQPLSNCMSLHHWHGRKGSRLDLHPHHNRPYSQILPFPSAAPASSAGGRGATGTIRPRPPPTMRISPAKVGESQHPSLYLTVTAECAETHPAGGCMTHPRTCSKLGPVAAIVAPLTLHRLKADYTCGCRGPSGGGAAHQRGGGALLQRPHGQARHRGVPGGHFFGSAV